MNDFERFVEKNNQIYLSRRIIQFSLGIFLFLVFVAFMIGYFIGIKHATDEFVTQMRHETLADHLLISSGIHNHSSPSDTVESLHFHKELVSESPIALTENNSVHHDVYKDDKKSSDNVQPIEILTSYNAELIGFGTYQAAQSFIDRVHVYSDIKLELKERASKTPRGKAIKWYQVVTEKYEQKNELQNILDILIKKEHLHDVKIVAYSATKKDLV
jgi:hypothetical protein